MALLAGTGSGLAAADPTCNTSLERLSFLSPLYRIHRVHQTIKLLGCEIGIGGFILERHEKLPDDLRLWFKCAISTLANYVSVFSD